MELFSIAGYALASLAYFVFILLLLAARNNTCSGKLILVASTVTLAAYALGALQQIQHFSLQFVLLAETVKIGLWSLLLLCTQERIQSFSALFSNKHIKQYLVTWCGLSVTVWAITFYSGNAGYLFFLFLILNLWAVVLLEQLYRNANVKAKWALWPLVVALGAVCIFEFILFAQASMLNQLNFDLWSVRAFVGILSVPFLLVSTRRIKDWSVNVFISRDVVFYSSMLMISGVYLLIMALSGYVLNYLGGKWGTMLSVSFLSLGGIVLAVLLMTEKIRREVKVFITKHFFANRYDYRVEWLKLIEQLEVSESVNYYKTALNTISSTLKIDHGLLLKKQGHGHYKTLYSEGIESSEALINEIHLIDQYCRKNHWIIDIAEYQTVEKSYVDLFLDIELLHKNHVAIVVPIFVQTQHYGYFVLSSPNNENKLLNWEDRDLLSAISKQLSHYLTLHEASEELSQAKQFDAFNRMSAFLVHDLKNIQAQLALINTNAKKHRNNPEFIDDVFETVESATTRLDKTLQQLRNKQVVDTETRSVALNSVISQVINQRKGNLPEVIAGDVEDVLLVVDEEKLLSVINHLVQNAQEATSDSGSVNINVNKMDNFVNITITDTGSGMSADFVKDRLFKPFDTTKGNAGMGIGVFEAKQFAESVNGELTVSSEEGKGTTFTLALPVIL